MTYADHLSGFDATDPSAAPFHLICQPYGRTGARHMVTIVAGPFAELEDAERALPEDKEAFIGLIRPVPPFPSLSEMPEDLTLSPFVSASWTKRSSNRIRVHTRRQMILSHVESESKLLIQLEKDARRKHFTMEIIGSKHVDGLT